MDKESVVCIHNGKLSLKKEIPCNKMDEPGEKGYFL
jgi:hypothetical protein